jgi:hypothetical protein
MAAAQIAPGVVRLSARNVFDRDPQAHTATELLYFREPANSAPPGSRSTPSTAIGNASRSARTRR